MDRILYADPDEDFRSYAAAALARLGLLAVGVDTAAELMLAIEGEPASLVVIDEQLPDASGTVLCGRVRGRAGLPIVFTAQTDSVELRVRALQLGADDALLKPFDPRELAARIRAVIRRGQTGPAHQCLRIAGWTLDIGGRVLTAPGAAPRKLSSVEFLLLSELMRHPNRLLSRDHLSRAVRGLAAGPLDRYVDNLVSKLRRKLDDVADEPQLIRTFRGEGYVLHRHEAGTDASFAS